MPHQWTFRNFTHWAWAIWVLSNHSLFWKIRDAGREKRIISSPDSISTIPFQAGTSYVKIVGWGEYCSNSGILCLTRSFGTFRGTWDPSNKNPFALYRCSADIFWNITNREIQWPGLLIARKFGQLSLVGCTHDGHNCSSCWKLILHISPQIACIHLTVYLAIFAASTVHWIKIEVCLKWEMCQKEM
jgi:hypothetical protein